MSDTCTTRADWTADTSLTTEYTAAFTSSLRLDTGKHLHMFCLSSSINKTSYSCRKWLSFIPQLRPVYTKSDASKQHESPTKITIEFYIRTFQFKFKGDVNCHKKNSADNLHTWLSVKLIFSSFWEKFIGHMKPQQKSQVQTQIFNSPR